ncbi:MAG: sigma-54-dependent Fis family transcriptional regulator [Alphaproteobacteria bacterium]|nr:sigma-54 dependent transcriptional regulator [Alphaproteobacteria bacterium]MDE2336343.1 sigma-54-dependent Fis family transcriptional regulator [Alphaproteobacteria bacterium]
MRLMIIGSLSGQISTAGKIAIGRGAKVTHTEDVEQALGALRSGRGADLIMMDVKLDIALLIEQLKNERFAIPVVACGIGTDAATAVKAIKAGAKEYIPLPPNAELIAAVLEAIAEENNTMLAQDPAMKAVLVMADRVAPSDATILVTGESGTGKEVMSRYIHQKSKRAGGPFISLNCAAIPENLLESELFGHEKGAFTGAVARRIGKFEEANGGTLLLDEVSEMHPSLQAKLLRAIQERVIDRIGGKGPVKIDIRLIATSNRDLESYVKEGNFREDLYHRLNVINLALPPLRDRPSDIVPLAQMFAEKYGAQNGLPKKKISAAAAARLKAHDWPGNIRELENTLHRAVLMSQENEIEAAAILISGQKQPAPEQNVAQTAQAVAQTAEKAAGAAASGETSAALVGRTVADVERELILNTLDHCLGNRTQAANILGISIRTLRNKLKEYGAQEMSHG